MNRDDGWAIGPAHNDTSTTDVMMKSSTMADETRPRLGRGLAALIGDSGEETGAVQRARGKRKSRLNFCAPIHAIRVINSMRPNCRN